LAKFPDNFDTNDVLNSNDVVLYHATVVPEPMFAFLIGAAGRGASRRYGGGGIALLLSRSSGRREWQKGRLAALVIISPTPSVIMRSDR